MLVRRQTEPFQSSPLKPALDAARFDWHKFFMLSERNGVAVSVDRSLGSLGPKTGLPSSLHRRFDQHCRALESRALFLSVELERVLRALGAEGIRAMPYKGPVWVEALYGAVSAREYLDLDLLVKKGQERTAREALERLGYRFRWTLSPARERAVLFSQCHYQLEGPSEGLMVELHWDVAPSYLPWRLDLEGIFERASSTGFGSVRVLMPAPEDLICLLAVHGTKDLWQRLSWVCDFDRALARYGGAIDWEPLLERAEKEGWDRALFLAAQLCAQLLGGPPPPALERRLARAKGLQGLVERAVRQMFGAENHRFGVWPSAAFHLRALPGLGRKLSYAAGYAAVLATPTFHEWERWPLPDKFFPAYYPLRALRLASRFFMGGSPKKWRGY